jgi:hypothetical protein
MLVFEFYLLKYALNIFFYHFVDVDLEKINKPHINGFKYIFFIRGLEC